MYGTRDAAMSWLVEVAKEIIRLGFSRGRYNPCLYYHPKRNLRTFIRGGDLATVGTRDGVKLFKDPVEKTRLFKAVDTIPCVQKKAEWALKWVCVLVACFVFRLRVIIVRTLRTLA